MTPYHLDEPHLEALRWACAEAANEWFRIHEIPADVRGLAWSVIHSPSLSASLIRDLLARAGFDVAIEGGSTWRVVPSDDGVWVRGGPERLRKYNMPDVPRLISALCDFAPGDREGAMRVLRGVGR